MKPHTRLFIVDAVRTLDRHGPKCGDPEDVSVRTTLAAGLDPVALDAFAAELMGRDPQQIGSIVHAAREELGTMDYRSLRPVEIAVS